MRSHELRGRSVVNSASGGKIDCVLHIVVVSGLATIGGGLPRKNAGDFWRHGIVEMGNFVPIREFGAGPSLEISRQCGVPTRDLAESTAEETLVFDALRLAARPRYSRRVRHDFNLSKPADRLKVAVLRILQSLTLTARPRKQYDNELTATFSLTLGALI